METCKNFDGTMFCTGQVESGFSGHKQGPRFDFKFHLIALDFAEQRKLVAPSFSSSSCCSSSLSSFLVFVVVVVVLLH